MSLKMGASFTSARDRQARRPSRGHIHARQRLAAPRAAPGGDRVSARGSAPDHSMRLGSSSPHTPGTELRISLSIAKRREQGPGETSAPGRRSSPRSARRPPRGPVSRTRIGGRGSRGLRRGSCDTPRRSRRSTITCARSCFDWTLFASGSSIRTPRRARASRGSCAPGSIRVPPIPRRSRSLVWMSSTSGSPSRRLSSSRSCSVFTPRGSGRSSSESGGPTSSKSRRSASSRGSEPPSAAPSRPGRSVRGIRCGSDSEIRSRASRSPRPAR